MCSRAASSHDRPTSRYDPGMAPVSTASDTRQKIIDAGSELARAHGVLGLSVDNVLATAGVSKGGFFHHFRTKHELIVAVVESELDRFETEVAARERDGLSFPEAISETILDFVESNATMMASVNAALSFGDDLRVIVTKRRAAWRLRLRRSLDAPVRADLLSIAIDGVIFSCSMRSERVTRSELAAMRDALWLAMGRRE